MGHDDKKGSKGARFKKKGVLRRGRAKDPT